MPVNHSLDDFQKAHSLPSSALLNSSPLPDKSPETTETPSPNLFTTVYSTSQSDLICNSCGASASHYWLETDQALCEDCKIW